MRPRVPTVKRKLDETLVGSFKRSGKTSWKDVGSCCQIWVYQRTLVVHGAGFQLDPCPEQSPIPEVEGPIASEKPSGVGVQHRVKYRGDGG